MEPALDESSSGVDLRKPDIQNDLKFHHDLRRPGARQALGDWDPYRNATRATGRSASRKNGAFH
jgi:hypothetical protein